MRLMRNLKSFNGTYEEKTQFSLNAEQWEKFNKILDEKPDVTALKELLNSKGVL